MTSIQAIVSDMDGVLWLGEQPLPGLAEFFVWLHRQRLPFVLATNNSSKSPADYVAKLARMGVPGVPESAILTSGVATIAYLSEHYPPGTRVHVIGGDGLRELVTQGGFVLADDDVAVVAAGLDRQLTYDKLEHAAFLIRAGAHFVGTNADATYPTERGPAPGAGSLLAALATAAECEPVIIGKPHPPMFEAALHLLGQPAGAVLMIGDRLNTDIQGAAALGMQTALVLTGISSREDVALEGTAPDMIFPDLLVLIEALEA